MDSLEDYIADASFVRWVRGEAAPGEETRWNTWLQEAPEHRRLAEEAGALMSALVDEEIGMPYVREELLKLGKSIDQRERQEKFFQLRNEKFPFRNYRSLTAAAVLIAAICLGAFVAYQYHFLRSPGEEGATGSPGIHEYKTDYGEKAMFRLSDESRIVLNANSHIRFSADIDGEPNTTMVWLQGEAWFDITHFEDEYRRTFAVETPDGSVEVLGTRFTVKTFENETRAVLEEGEIQVRVTSHAAQSAGRSFSQGEGETVLQPGDMALFSTGSKRVVVEKVNPRIYTSWHEDIWFFEDTPVEEVARRIEDTFGLEVKVREELVERRLSGSIKSTNVNVLTEALSKILEAEIEQNGQVLYIGMSTKRVRSSVE